MTIRGKLSTYYSKQGQNVEKELIYVKHTELSEFRKDQYNKQQGICPILKKKIVPQDSVLDHKHKLKNDPVNKDNSGGGLIRGVIHNSCNQVEGKIQNAYQRFGLENHISLPEFLRNLADYIENPPVEQIYVHPKEWPVPKAPKLYLRDYKLVCKYWHLISPKIVEPPIYPRTGRTNKKWDEWIAKAKKLKEQGKDTP